MGATNATASSSSSRRRRAAVKSRSRSAVACCLLAAGGAFAQTTVAAPGQPEHSGTPNAFQIVGDSVASAQQVCSSTDATFTLVYSSSIMRRCFWVDRIVFTSWTRRKTTRRRSRATLRGQPVRFFTFFMTERERILTVCMRVLRILDRFRYCPSHGRGHEFVLCRTYAQFYPTDSVLTCLLGWRGARKWYMG